MRWLEYDLQTQWSDNCSMTFKHSGVMTAIWLTNTVEWWLEYDLQTQWSDDCCMTFRHIRVMTAVWLTNTLEWWLDYDLQTQWSDDYSITYRHSEVMFTVWLTDTVKWCLRQNSQEWWNRQTGGVNEAYAGHGVSACMLLHLSLVTEVHREHYDSAHILRVHLLSLKYTENTTLEPV